MTIRPGHIAKVFGPILGACIGRGDYRNALCIWQLAGQNTSLFVENGLFDAGASKECALVGSMQNPRDEERELAFVDVLCIAVKCMIKDALYYDVAIRNTMDEMTQRGETNSVLDMACH